MADLQPGASSSWCTRKERKSRPSHVQILTSLLCVVLKNNIRNVLIYTGKGCQQLNCADEVPGSYLVQSTSIHFEDIQGTAFFEAKRGLAGEMYVSPFSSDQKISQILSRDCT
jgi:hypothetical protein